jgi:hypothetical protein
MLQQIIKLALLNSTASPLFSSSNHPVFAGVIPSEYHSIELIPPVPPPWIG